MNMIAVLVALLVIALGARFTWRRRFGRPPAEDVAVTLSVLQRRTAVVVLDIGSDAPSEVLSRLANRAVRDAFAFEAVEVVEVRAPGGELLYLRRRHDTHRDRRAARPLRPPC